MPINIESRKCASFLFFMQSQDRIEQLFSRKKNVPKSKRAISFERGKDFENEKNVCSFVLILYVPSIIFQLCRDVFPGLNQNYARINVSCSSIHNAVTPVRIEPRPLGLDLSTLPLSHCAPKMTNWWEFAQR